MGTREIVGAKKGHHASGMQVLRKHLFSGLLVLLPLGISFLILKVLFNVASGILKPLLKTHMVEVPELLLPILSVLLLAMVIWLVGFFTSLVVGRRIVAFGERILMQVPLLKSIYGASKQAVEVFVASDKTSFESVVLVEFPRPGVESVGFVTGTVQDGRGHKCLKVFVPTSPNPTTGFLLIIREENVRQAGMSVEEGIKMVVSGGILGPPVLGGHESPHAGPAT